MKRAEILLGFAMLLNAGAVRGQQPASQQGSGDGEQAGGEPEEQKPAARGPSRGSGIVADNLDRVAATVEQILEVVNRDAGLMVELKRAIAQDAGESGQILEESDLSERAVAERLSEDLRTRVLATRLLRKYGYLVPKLNPDSDLAQEQRLVLQERAQELARASERNYPPREQAPEALANCDSQQKDCELPQRTPFRTRAYSNVDGRETLPGSEVPQLGDRPAQLSRPQVLRSQAAEPGSEGPMLVSSSQGYSGGVSSFSRRRSAVISPEGTSSLEPFANEGQRSANALSDATFEGGATRSGPRDFERRYAAGRGTDGAIETVRMVHRPNPYADVPSLYDLYVQASSPTRRVERFGAELFRHGAINPEVLPMDLPVGPDYVVVRGSKLHKKQCLAAIRRVSCAARPACCRTRAGRSSGRGPLAGGFFAFCNSR